VIGHSSTNTDRSAAVSLIHFIILFHSFFNDTSTTQFYTLSLHDALPIFCDPYGNGEADCQVDEIALNDHDFSFARRDRVPLRARDRKSTHLNSSHVAISYAVFCLKKKKILTGIESLYLL